MLESIRAEFPWPKDEVMQRFARLLLRGIRGTRLMADATERCDLDATKLAHRIDGLIVRCRRCEGRQLEASHRREMGSSTYSILASCLSHAEKAIRQSRAICAQTRDQIQTQAALACALLQDVRGGQPVGDLFQTRWMLLCELGCDTAWARLIHDCQQHVDGSQSGHDVDQARVRSAAAAHRAEALARARRAAHSLARRLRRERAECSKLKRRFSSLYMRHRSSSLFQARDWERRTSGAAESRASAVKAVLAAFTLSGLVHHPQEDGWTRRMAFLLQAMGHSVPDLRHGGLAPTEHSEIEKKLNDAAWEASLLTLELQVGRGRTADSSAAQRQAAEVGP